MGGTNVFQYAPNPTGWIDPFGLTPEYYPFDSLGRPTGGFAEVTSSTIGTGSNASSSIRPPGFIDGRHPHHQERGHLIANNHGGSGKDARNLVTITDGTNHPGMTRHENKVTRHVNAGNTVLIEVKPNYIGNNPIPDSISMYAIDQDARVVVDTTVQNGRRKNTKCCL